MDRAVARLAARQHGVVSRAQLLDAGLTRHGIAHRVESGRLHRVHRRVFAVGHAALGDRGRWLAAVLACGPGAVLSCFTAAVLWELLPGWEDQGRVHVTTAGPHRRPPAGVRLHRTAELPRRDVSRRAGLPVTAPARTLLDLAGVATTRDLERALTQARLRRLVRPEELNARAGGRRGAEALRALLAEEPAFTRSDAERSLLALLARAELPTPRTNVRIGRFEVDAVWPDQRLVVEVDGYAYHSSRAAFERDRLRDAGLGAAGFRVVRITWRQLTDRPEALAARLATALTADTRRPGSGAQSSAAGQRPRASTSAP